MIPVYLLEKIARHGYAAQRLAQELAAGEAELGEYSRTYAAAFDAADFIWAFLALQGFEPVQESREVRNRVAEAILNALAQYEWLESPPDR